MMVDQEDTRRPKAYVIEITTKIQALSMGSSEKEAIAYVEERLKRIAMHADDGEIPEGAYERIKVEPIRVTFAKGGCLVTVDDDES